MTTASQHYNLQFFTVLQQNNNGQFPDRTGHLTNGNFITRLLYKDFY